MIVFKGFKIGLGLEVADQMLYQRVEHESRLCSVGGVQVLMGFGFGFVWSEGQKVW